MNFIKPGKRNFIVILTLLLFALSVRAENSVSIQQKHFHELESVWTTPHIPVGMPSVDRGGNSRSSGTTGVSVFVRHVQFNFTGDIGFNIENLSASFEPIKSYEPVNLDNPLQFIIRVHRGEVVVPPHSLAALFNKQILAYWPRPLNNMRFITHKNSLIVETGLRLWNWFPFVWLPAQLEGNIILNQQNQLVYTPRSVKVLGIPMSGLLNTFGIKLTMLISLNREGAHLIGNSIVLNHKKVFPPPALEGKICRAMLDDSGLHLTFDDNGPVGQFSPPPNSPNSFIWIQSGDIKLFNIVVTNANILIKDENPSCDMIFDLYNYRCLIGQKNIIKLFENGTLIVTLSTIKNCLDRRALNSENRYYWFKR